MTTADKPIIWRGSVTDLATDIAAELTGEQLQELQDSLGRWIPRAPVQGDRNIKPGTPGHQAGTISWIEHNEAWQDYARRHGRDQSAKRMAERGGFGYLELVGHLGRLPRSWEPR